MTDLAEFTLPCACLQTFPTNDPCPQPAEWILTFLGAPVEKRDQLLCTEHAETHSVLTRLALGMCVLEAI